MAASQMYPSFNIFTWGSCRYGYLEILYPQKIDVVKVTNRQGDYIVDLGAVVLKVKNYDSRKNLHRDIEIVEVREPIVVKYYGNASCSRSFLELWVIDRNGARQISKDEIRSRIITKENGKYRYEIQQFYIEFSGRELIVDEIVLKKEIIPEKAGIVARVRGTRIEVSGDTYHVRDILKQLKFRWDYRNKVWYNDCADDDDVGYTIMELEAQLKERGFNLVIEG